MSRKERNAIPVYLVDHPNVAFLKNCFSVVLVLGVLAVLGKVALDNMSFKSEDQLAAGIDAWRGANEIQKMAITHFGQAENIKEWVPLIDVDSLQTLTQTPGFIEQPVSLLALEGFNSDMSHEEVVAALKNLEGLGEEVTLDLTIKLETYRDHGLPGRFIRMTKKAGLWFDTGYPHQSVGNLLALSNFVLTEDESPRLLPEASVLESSVEWDEKVFPRYMEITGR